MKDDCNSERPSPIWAEDISPELEYTPDEVALVRRVQIFVKFRWLAVACIILLTFFASEVFHVEFSILPLLIIAFVVGLYNIGLYFQARSLNVETAPPQVVLKKAHYYGVIHIVLDLIALTFLIHYSGGVENPFLFYFTIHAVIASIILSKKAAYLTAVFATVLVFLLLALEYFQVIPHVHLEGFIEPCICQDLKYILAVLFVVVTTLFASIYMISSIAGRLRGGHQRVLGIHKKKMNELQQDLVREEEELETVKQEKLRLIRFLGVASHDLKAPLSAIQSYFQVLLGGFAGELPEKQRYMIERSSIRVKGLFNLISDLLDISAIASGKLVKEMEMVSVREVAEKSLEDIEKCAEEKKITLASELPPRGVTLRASPIRLQEALTNLLSNALKFTPPQGKISLACRNGAEEVLFEVSDTGIGIPEEDQPKIFSEFYRSKMTNAEGSGLGLFIVKRIVEAHGGRIWVKSPLFEDRELKGSRFYFTIPKTIKESTGRGGEQGNF